jgi:hypothetical protein
MIGERLRQISDTIDGFECYAALAPCAAGLPVFERAVVAGAIIETANMVELVFEVSAGRAADNRYAPLVDLIPQHYAEAGDLRAAATRIHPADVEWIRDLRNSAAAHIDIKQRLVNLLHRLENTDRSRIDAVFHQVARALVDADDHDHRAQPPGPSAHHRPGRRPPDRHARVQHRLRRVISAVPSSVPLARPLVGGALAWHAGAMAHPIVSTPRLEAAMDRIRPVAVALPGVVERLSHGSPTFFTAEGRKGRTFASVHDEREWHEGRLCVWAAAANEVQERWSAEHRSDTSCRPTSVTAAGSACGSTFPRWTGTMSSASSRMLTHSSWTADPPRLRPARTPCSD